MVVKVCGESLEYRYGLGMTVRGLLETDSSDGHNNQVNNRAARPATTPLTGVPQRLRFCKSAQAFHIRDVL